MTRRRAAGLAAVALCVLFALYVVRAPSPEARVLEIVTELGRAGGLPGKADAPPELRAKLARALAPKIELSTEYGRERVLRELLIEQLLVAATEQQGVYSLYDLRAVVRQEGKDASVRAVVRGRLAPRDMRNELQGLDARGFTVRLRSAGDDFLIDAIELSSASAIEPEARP